jgi:hypothetical protein
LSARQDARKIKAMQLSPELVRYADGLIALGEALKDPKSSVRKLAALSLDVGLHLKFTLKPEPTPPPSGREIG